MELTRKVVRDAVEPFPLHTKMRWFAEINSWRIPDDFPVQVPAEWKGKEMMPERNDPEWRAVFDGATQGLTDAEASLGWWLFSTLKKTPLEWLAWWEGRGKHDGKQTVNAYLISRREEAPQ